MAIFIEIETMKRAHRKVHTLIWLSVPFAFAAIIWLAANIHGTQL